MTLTKEELTIIVALYNVATRGKYEVNAEGAYQLTSALDDAKELIETKAGEITNADESE
jgi:hypothetical protein